MRRQDFCTYLFKLFIMDYDFPKSTFYRALMTGLFVGIIDTLICLLFNLFYRESTGFSPSAIVNVATLIFFINLLFPLIGIIYNGFLKASRKGEIGFIILFILLTGLCIWLAEGVNRTDDATLNTEFRTLLLGIVLVLGLSAAFLLPYLFHNRNFEKHVV